MGEFSLLHILVVGVIVLILFGSNKLPVFGQSLGRAIRGFKDGLTEDSEVDGNKTAQSNQLNQSKAEFDNQAKTSVKENPKV